MAAGNFAKDLRMESTCSICLDYFTDPVTIDCGHNFCRACLSKSWRPQGRKASCPHCRGLARPRNLKPNLQLANIVEISKRFSLHVSQGAEGTGGVCEKHQEPLKRFCREDKAPICVVCEGSTEHQEHRVIPAEEAAAEYKEKIQAILEKETQMRVEQKKAEEQRSKVCQKQLEEKKQKMTAALDEVRRYLHEKEHCWLRQLAGLEEEIKEKQEENMTRLTKEISHFSNLSKDMELRYQQPPSEFLQDVRDIMNRGQKRKMREKLELSPGLEWRFRSDTPKIALLKKTIDTLEGSLMPALSKVSVTLDPDTAHPCLLLSEDLKRVWYEGSKQNLPDNPERFDEEFFVLGRERFASGRHCWEVGLEKLNGGMEMWTVGVARESLTRKGLVCPCPSPNKIWAVGKVPSRPQVVLAYSCIVPTPLTLRGEPKKIRVFLDYEEGCVELFNADTDDLIFTFPPASFCGEGVRPFFGVVAGVRLNCGI